MQNDNENTPNNKPIIHYNVLILLLGFVPHPHPYELQLINVCALFMAERIDGVMTLLETSNEYA